MATYAALVVCMFFLGGASAGLPTDHCADTEIQSELLMRDYEAKEKCPGYCKRKDPKGTWSFSGEWRCVQWVVSHKPVFCCCGCTHNSSFDAVFADVQDGVKKQMTHVGNFLTIKPNGTLSLADFPVNDSVGGGHALEVIV
eukprot:TRINITY_DN72459_c0_g1_i1.p1 TRINITY_DN72459_c0_g1~~TRINITY_DN72459_c0_g1_i1.p1  ORF type:complete len:165 (-),score=19.17 TRINITY_DN72459_c0_g1_i1:64-486(-)